MRRRTPPTEAFDPVLAARDQLPGWQGISPFVGRSVLWSLYAALRSPSNYWDAICTAVAVGGDVDTTAAMAGAIAGAAVGPGGIPHEPAQLVTDQGTWGHAALVDLARELHASHRQLRQEAS